MGKRIDLLSADTLSKMTGASSGESQEPRATFRSFACGARTQVFGPSFAAFQGTTPGSWIRSEAAGSWTSALTWDASVGGNSLAHCVISLALYLVIFEFVNNVKEVKTEILLFMLKIFLLFPMEIGNIYRDVEESISKLMSGKIYFKVKISYFDVKVSFTQFYIT